MAKAKTASKASPKKAPPPLRAAKNKSLATIEKAGQNVVEQQTMIAEAAYFIAEHRGFSTGHELGDWLQAEREIHAGMLQQ